MKIVRFSETADGYAMDCSGYAAYESYSVEKTKSDWPAGDRSRGDWLVDELLVLDDGFLSHEIVFTRAVIRIKHRDLKHVGHPAAQGVRRQHADGLFL